MQMKVLLLPVAVLAACGPPPIYVTRCGLEYHGQWPNGEALPGWEQPKMQHFEDLFLAGQSMFSLDERTSNPVEACRSLKSYKIWNHETPETCWATPWHATLSCGLTFCPSGAVELPQTPIENTAFAHELVHVAQNCRAIQPPSDGRDDQHADWTRNGQQKGINWASETMRNDVADGGVL